jgi:hypothetical protein
MNTNKRASRDLIIDIGRKDICKTWLFAAQTEASSGRKPTIDEKTIAQDGKLLIIGSSDFLNL